MKPTLSPMDEKTANVSVVMQPQNEPKRGNKRLVLGIVGGVIIVVVAVAAVLTAVFVGAKLTKDGQKEAWLNFRDTDGHPDSEHVVTNDREIDYTYPNKMRVIYDFEKGYAVHKFENFPKKGSHSVCYVSHLNRTSPATPQQVKDAMTDNEIEVPERPGSEELQFESTMQEFDRNLLSPRAQEMCKNSDVVWMATSKDAVSRRRREACPPGEDLYRVTTCYYYLVYQYGQWWLVRICYYEYVCLTPEEYEALNGGN